MMAQRNKVLREVRAAGIALGIFAAVAFGVLWGARAYLLSKVESEQAFRQRLESSGHLEAIKSFAAARLGTSSAVWNESSKADQQLTSDWKLTDMLPIFGDDGKTAYVLFARGGGFRHYGLAVGPPGQPPDIKTLIFHEWTPGVWFYDER